MPDAYNRELEYRIPRLHSPVSSLRFPQPFGDLCKNKTSLLYIFVENASRDLAPFEVESADGRPQLRPRPDIINALKTNRSEQAQCCVYLVRLYV